MVVSNTNKESDVLVVGAGVIGLSGALALLLQGRSVRILEARTVGAGASHGNCGTITPSHAPPLAAPGVIARALGWSLQPNAPLYIPPRFDPALWRWLMAFARRCNTRDWHTTALAKSALLNASRPALAEWVQRLNLQCEFRETGEDYVFRDQHAFIEGQEELDLLAECGVSVELIDGAEYERQEPAMRRGVAGALRFRGDASLRPDEYVAELARVVRERGADLVEGSAVTAVERSGDRWRVRTADGAEYFARDVVLSTGAWSAQLEQIAGSRVRNLARALQPGKGYSITYSRPAVVPSRPLVLRERFVCVSMWDGMLRIGSTMEFSGFDASLNEKRFRALEDAASDYLLYPSGPETLERWTGWRPMVSDDIPLIGAVPGQKGLWLHTGHGMMGMSMSTASSLLLSQLIVGDSDLLIDPAPYRPERFV